MPSITRNKPATSWSKYHTYDFDGVTFYRTKDGYYRAAQKVLGERLLHRVVWAHRHGQIAAGYDIHHKDDDKENNVLSNLEPRQKSEHLSYHFGIHEKTRRKQIAAIKRYLASPNGKAQRALTTKQRWDSLPEVEVACVECGVKFTTKIPDRATCCSNRCHCRRRYKNRRDSN